MQIFQPSNVPWFTFLFWPVVCILCFDVFISVFLDIIYLCHHFSKDIKYMEFSLFCILPISSQACSLIPIQTDHFLVLMHNCHPEIFLLFDSLSLFCFVLLFYCTILPNHFLNKCIRGQNIFSLISYLMV